MFAQHERTQIKQRTKLALDRIKSEIDEKGEYTSKAGNIIKKLGIHDKLDEAGIKGNKVNTELADKRAADVWPIIEGMLNKGLSYRAMARELNKMGVPTPTKRRNPDTSKRTEWYASSVRNYVLRMNGQANPVNITTK
jgi:DNA invertase Pin-like site-specific DNA recombinase